GRQAIDSRGAHTDQEFAVKLAAAGVFAAPGKGLGQSHGSNIGTRPRPRLLISPLGVAGLLMVAVPDGKPLHTFPGTALFARQGRVILGESGVFLAMILVAGIAGGGSGDHGS